MEDQLEIRLENDPVGRKFRIGTDEESFYQPCAECTNGMFNEDHYCCRKLRHGWHDHNDEFYGEDAFPFERLKEAGHKRLGRPVEYGVEDVIFYGCDSFNKRYI